MPNIEAQNILKRIDSVINAFDLIALKPQVRACHQQVEKSKGISVAVFGRFKAGKSSFINNLIGRAILPVGVIPITAVVTIIRYSPKEKCTVQFLNGSSQVIAITEIKDYVSESNNPNNQKNVAAIEIELPELKKFAPLEFIDTPGIGSAFAHNTETTHKWMPNVVAAVVAISADAPLSESDIQFLKELYVYTPQIVLLITKSDLFSTAQLSEIIAFVRNLLSNRLGIEYPIYPYSIKPEFEPFREQLEEAFLRPLIQDRETTANRILNHKLISLINQILDYLRIALTASTQQDSSRSALRLLLDEERQNFGLLQTEVASISRELANSALDFYLSQLQTTQDDLKNRIIRELDQQFPNWKHLRIPQMLDAWRDWVRKFLVSELKNISLHHRPMFCTPLYRAQQHLTRILNAFYNRLASQVNKALGIAIQPREFSLSINEPKDPPVDVSFAFDAAFTSIGWIMPKWLFRKTIEKNLLRKACWEVEKNVSRLCADWKSRIQIEIDRLSKLTENYATNELDTLEKMVNQQASMVPELTQTIQELTELKTFLTIEPQEPVLSKPV